MRIKVRPVRRGLPFSTVAVSTGTSAAALSVLFGPDNDGLFGNLYSEKFDIPYELIYKDSNGRTLEIPRPVKDLRIRNKREKEIVK